MRACLLTDLLLTDLLVKNMVCSCSKATRPRSTVEEFSQLVREVVFHHHMY